MTAHCSSLGHEGMHHLENLELDVGTASTIGSSASDSHRFNSPVPIAIPIPKPKTSRRLTLEVETLHQLVRGAPVCASHPVFTPISPVAVAVEFLHDDSDDDAPDLDQSSSSAHSNSSSSDNDNDNDNDSSRSIRSMLVTPCTPTFPTTPTSTKDCSTTTTASSRSSTSARRPSLLYVGENGKVQYTLGDDPPARLRDLKWYADQLAVRDSLMSDIKTGTGVEDADAALAGKMQGMVVTTPAEPASVSAATPVPAPSVVGDCSETADKTEVHLVNYGVVEICLDDTVAGTPKPAWHVPATAYIGADGVTIDMHRTTPEAVRARIIVCALRHAYNQLAPLMRGVEGAIRAAMPGYIGLSNLKPSLDDMPVAADMVRTHHTSAPVATSPLSDNAGFPRLILVNTVANMYILMYPAGAQPTSPEWVRFGGTLDLTPDSVPTGTVYQHPSAPPMVHVLHDLFFRALRRVVGVAAAPPPAVIRAMMRSDAVGEFQPVDEKHEDEDDYDYDYEGASDSDADASDAEVDFEVDPDMFGG